MVGGLHCRPHPLSGFGSVPYIGQLVVSKCDENRDWESRGALRLVLFLLFIIITLILLFSCSFIIIMSICWGWSAGRMRDT